MCCRPWPWPCVWRVFTAWNHRINCFVNCTANSGWWHSLQFRFSALFVFNFVRLLFLQFRSYLLNSVSFSTNDRSGRTEFELTSDFDHPDCAFIAACLPRLLFTSLFRFNGEYLFNVCNNFSFANSTPHTVTRPAKLRSLANTLSPIISWMSGSGSNNIEVLLLLFDWFSHNPSDLLELSCSQSH